MTSSSFKACFHLGGTALAYAANSALQQTLFGLLFLLFKLPARPNLRPMLPLGELRRPALGWRSIGDAVVLLLPLPSIAAAAACDGNAARGVAALVGGCIGGRAGEAAVEGVAETGTAAAALNAVLKGDAGTVVAAAAAAGAGSSSSLMAAALLLGSSPTSAS